jgi:predicted RNase H-like HicB family nuclease
MERRQVTYSLRIEERDGGFLACFPALPGCITWGDTYEKTIRNAREALAVYLESLDDLGKPLPNADDPDEAVSLGVTVRVPTAN